MSEWSDILDNVNQLCKKDLLLKHWFRGVNDNKFKLNSGLYRLSYPNILQLEKNLFYSFINYGDLLFDFDRSNSWNILFCMQHYRMKTRLLDWTKSFLTALFFANFDRKENSIASIWILNPMELNGRYTKKFGHSEAKLISIDTIPSMIKDYTTYFNNECLDIPSFALFPRLNNSRLIAQNARFTVQGNSPKPLEEEYKDMLGESLFKIDLPWSTYKESIDWLALNGINYYQLFPDLDGLSKHISMLYRIDK